MTVPLHIVNISGGKDSTACYLLALRRDRPFRAVMADTGNEHPWTVEYAETLHEKTGGPKVEVFRADFTDRIAQKRAYVAKCWARDGVPPALIDRAIAALQPTGNPFLDLVLWKGRFPSSRAQFCTEFLKSDVIDTQAIRPARQFRPVIQWLGVRRDESISRRQAPMRQTVRTPGLHAMQYFRPLIHWTARNVFSYAAAHGLEPNPLYLHGLRRVGCFPCINASKSEIAAIARRFPEAIDRIAEWEAICKDASKRGATTFFAADCTPEGAALAARIRALPHHEDRAAASAAASWPDVRRVARWAATDRGGWQLPLDLDPDDGVSCSSQYGLCE